LLLQGGHVIDPKNKIDAVRDVAIHDGKIAAVAARIPVAQARKVVNVSGLYVTPGLIDIHFHVGHGGAPLNWFSPDARTHFLPLGIPADLALQSGVTTIVDAGTSGAETFLQEKEEVIDRAKVRVLAFLNIVAVYSFESEDAEMPKAAGKIRFGYLVDHFAKTIAGGLLSL
jgi:dihydroorotase